MRLVVLDAVTLGEDLDLGVLKRFGEVTVYSKTDPAQTVERCQKADIVVTNKVVIDQKVMAACDTLKLICVAATGMNNVDLEEAAKRGIEVKNVAGYSTRSVVQHTFAMLFYLLEKLPYYDEYVRGGKWSRSGIFTCLDRPFWEIAGKRWGIVGLGTIGRAVAKTAEAFGAKIGYYSTSGENLQAEYPSLPLAELLAQSDIVSIHAPLNERTRGLIDRDALLKMKEGAVLLNLGRGGIVDEAALAEVLPRKEIYVGLDVTEKEPLSADSPLFEAFKTERLFITPHIAWTSIEARKKLLEGIVGNIESFLKRHTL